MPEFEGEFERRELIESFDVELEANNQYIIDVIGAPSALGRLQYADLSVFVDDIPVFLSYDYGPNGYLQAVISPLVTETYTLELNSLGSTGGFKLRVFEDDFRYHPLGGAPAGIAQSGGSSRGRINYDRDTDVHSVSLISGLTYDIEARGADSSSGSLADPELRMLDSGDGTTLAADISNSGAGADGRILYNPNYSGSHYLDVRGANGETGSYETVVSEGRGTRFRTTFVAPTLPTR